MFKPYTRGRGNLNAGSIGLSFADFSKGVGSRRQRAVIDASYSGRHVIFPSSTTILAKFLHDGIRHRIDIRQTSRSRHF